MSKLEGKKAVDRRPFVRVNKRILLPFNAGIVLKVLSKRISTSSDHHCLQESLPLINTIHEIQKAFFPSCSFSPSLYFRLKKEVVERVNNVAAEFRKVSNKQMAETTKRTIRENVDLNSRLQKMSEKTLELIASNDALKLKDKEYRLEIELLETVEKELSKKNAVNLKVQFAKKNC